MALARWKDLCLDASDAPRVASFWGDLLGLAREVQDSGDAVLRGQEPGQTIWANTVPEPKSRKNRVHLDLVLPSYAPLVAAGGRVLRDHETTRYRWTVLADPEGNELCVFAEGQDAPSALVVDADDAVALAAWWSEVLGAQQVEAPDGTPRWLDGVAGLPYDVWKFVPVPDEKTVKNRWHWDVTCDDIDGLVAKGATVLREPDGVIEWHVLADPVGNEFCAFAP
jgi:catechol 2,3-dioxygenase-like lactoylglutathione lyase family enzyme/predicted enzyme related to lactoylglutathione lyase